MDDKKRHPDQPTQRTPATPYTCALGRRIHEHIHRCLRSDPPEIPNVSSLCDAFHACPQTLRNAHHATGGEGTLVHYIIRARLEEAKRLLIEEGYSISAAWVHLRYPDQASFSNQFKKEYKMCVRDFVKENTNC